MFSPQSDREIGVALSVAAQSVLRRELGFLLALARAAGGALLFALPLFMTQEMWQLGIGLERWRLVLFLIVGLPSYLVYVRRVRRR